MISWGLLREWLVPLGELATVLGSALVCLKMWGR